MGRGRAVVAHLAAEAAAAAHPAHPAGGTEGDARQHVAGVIIRILRSLQKGHHHAQPIVKRLRVGLQPQRRSVAPCRRVLVTRHQEQVGLLLQQREGAAVAVQQPVPARGQGVRVSAGGRERRGALDGGLACGVGGGAASHVQPAADPAGTGGGREAANSGHHSARRVCAEAESANG